MKMGEHADPPRRRLYRGREHRDRFYVHSDNRKGAIVELSFDGNSAIRKLETLARSWPCRAWR